MDQLCFHVMQDSNVVRRSVAAGATLIPSANTDSFEVVIDGALAVQCHRHEGGSITLEVLGPGGCVPSGLAGSALPDQMGLSALMPSSVARVPQSSFERVLARNPSLASAGPCKFVHPDEPLTCFPLRRAGREQPGKRVIGSPG